MIDTLTADDLDACAVIMQQVYNNPDWQGQWSLDTARAYLLDYVKQSKFVGYTGRVDGRVIGAIFCHEKIWWNASEVFVDEMFIAPAYQRQGYGTALLQAVEGYIKQHGLAGFTLTTNRYAPAPEFYRKNGFADAEHVLCMYKLVG